MCNIGNKKPEPKAYYKMLRELTVSRILQLKRELKLAEEYLIKLEERENNGS